MEQRYLSETRGREKEKERRGENVRE